jgi:hypothetical protein
MNILIIVLTAATLTATILVLAACRLGAYADCEQHRD